MVQIRSFLSRFQLQYRRTTTLHKVVVAAAVVLSSMTLISMRLAHWEAEEHLADLRRRNAILEQRNEDLRSAIGILGTTDSIRDIAREELGLVEPDTIIFEQAD